MAATNANNLEIVTAGIRIEELIYEGHQEKIGSTKALWAGRVISALAVAFLLFDAVLKLLNVAPVAAAESQLGIPQNLTLTIGIIELLCVIAYTFRPTSIIGAVLLTGYLGGAVAIQMRVGNPLPSHVLFPTYVGALLWAGLYLRDASLRQLIIRK